MGEKTPMRTLERAEFYERIAPLNLAPLWERLHNLVTPEPVTDCQPTIWHYAEVRPHLMRSGSLITAMEATRRVLMLENPGYPGQATTTGSIERMWSINPSVSLRSAPVRAKSFFFSQR